MKGQDRETPPSVEDFFAGEALARAIFEAVRQAMEGLGPVEVRASKSQIAFRKIGEVGRTRTVAIAWRPQVYLGRKAAPLVLTLFFRQRDLSTRWKEVVEPAPGRFTHHLELERVEDVDATVREWLRAAWEQE